MSNSNKQVSREVVDYLIHRYKQWGHLPRDSAAVWDPYKYPETDHIPFCSQCEADYTNFRQTNKQQECTVEMAHGTACLWQPYFVERIRRLNPKARCVVRRNGETSGAKGKKLRS